MTKKAKRLNLEDFIRKAKEKEAKKEKIFLIEVEEYGELEFRRPTMNEILNYTDANSGAFTFDEDGNVLSQSVSTMLEASRELVYQCCSFLQSQELRESLEIEDPLDTPARLFGIGEKNRIAETIAGRVNNIKVQKKVTEEIKNS